MRPAGGLRTRAALGAVAGVLAAVLIVGIVLATQSAPDGRGGLAGTLILAALVGGALAAGLTAYLMNREVRALRQVWRSTESLLSPEGVEPFPRTGGPEIRNSPESFRTPPTPCRRNRGPSNTTTPASKPCWRP